MLTSVTLPTWLDKLIFQKMGAKFCRSNADMTVIDWDKADMLKYLGTYFPRSYAESYCIFKDYFAKEPSNWENRSEVSVFDFGCGTGGEIIGLIFSLAECFPKIKTIKIKGLDGNFCALRLLENIIQEISNKTDLRIDFKASALKIDDIYDMTIINNVLRNKYDIIMSFKAICEFVSKKQFEERNPYQYLPIVLKDRLNDNGILLLEDVTTYNNTLREWLPKMMDRGLNASHCQIKYQNEGYNQCFLVTHSHRKDDKSKVAWRIIMK